MRSQEGRMIDRTDLFKQYKQEIHNNQNRYRKLNQMIQKETDNTNMSSVDLLETNHLTFDPYQDVKTNPQYIELYQDCQHKFIQYQELYNQLNNLQARRLKAQFDDADQLDKQITKNTNNSQKIMSLIKNNLDILQRIKEYNQSVESIHEVKVIQNLELRISQQIKEKTTKYRNLQKNLCQVLKKLQDEGDNAQFFQLSNDKLLEMRDFDNFDQNQQQEQLDTQESQKNQQIMELVNSISELNSIYKQMSEHVIEQGSILDRIDVNIDDIQREVVNANKELKKANNYQKSKCSRNIILIFSFLIVIFFVLLCIKLYSNREQKQQSTDMSNLNQSMERNIGKFDKS